MSLRFILGRAGSGKTTYCLDKIREKLHTSQEGNNLILLVPEQATFQMEMELAKTPDLNGIIRAQVFSFNRLTWKILQEVGGGSKVHLSDLGKTMVIRKFLEQRKEEFQVFRRASELPGFAETMGAMISELKLYQISLEEIKSFLQEKRGEDSLLFDKLKDLTLIYEDLEKYLADTYIDTDDYLNLLAEKIHLSPMMKKAEIWIDEFTGFTPQELKVIEKIMVTAPEVNITLTLDPAEIDQEYGLFKTTANTYKRILDIAHKTGTPIEKPLLLDNLFRFQDRTHLSYLERNFYKLEAEPLIEDGIAEEIKIVCAQNRRAEVEWVARYIRKLCIDQSLRYREIGILLRDFENYDLLLETIFADNEIPYFVDRKRPIAHHPLVELIRSALEIIEEDWSYEAIFRYLKTDLANISRSDVDLLENYVIAYGIKGSTWYKEKNWSYRKRKLGLEEKVKDQEQKELDYINYIRFEAIKELKVFQEKIKNSTTTRAKVEALFDLLIDLEVPVKLKRWAVLAEEQGRLEKAREHSQIWDESIDLLDQLVETMGDEELSLANLIKIIEAGIDNIKMGLIPPGLDQVVIGSLGRSRISELKVVFVIGVEDGVLPARPKAEGLLDDLERAYLKEMGLELAPGTREKIFDEQFLVYQALTRTTNILVLSYPLADEEGKGLRPSMVINRVKELFPNLVEENVGNDPSGDSSLDLDFVSHPDKTLGKLGIKLRQAREGLAISPVWWEVYRWYLDQPERQERLGQLVKGLFQENQVQAIDPVLAKKLYGNPFRLSISRLEKFNACPFSHFTTYGLALQEREVYSLKLPDLGQFFHSALEHFAQKLLDTNRDWGQLNKKECWELTNTIVEELAPQLQSEILLSTARYRYLTGKFKKTVNRAAITLAEHARRGKFRPLALEVAFGPGGQMPGLKLTLQDGTVMELAGRIDRLDGCQSEDKFFLRVIDYKSGNAGLDMVEVFYGLKLQLITYLDIALNYAQELIKDKEIVPAGILYFHLQDPIISSAGPLAEDKIDAEILKELKMQGLVLADIDVFQLQDNETKDGWSPIIPAGLKKEGAKLLQEGKALQEDMDQLDLFYKDSKIMTLEQIEVLRTFIRNSLIKGGEKILEGDVQISPYQFKNKTPCSYCAFQAVCQFDPKFSGNDYRELKALSKEEIMQEMMKAEQ